MSRRLRILLVQPAWNGLAYRRKIKVDERSIHPLAMGVVATLSHPHEVCLINESQESVPTDASGFDVAGISVNTFNAPRAYALADRLKAQRVPVVFGGPHTALMPEECLKHADSIVIGDAEDTWPRALDDLMGGRLQPRYQSGLEDGSLFGPPRRALFKNNNRHVAFCQMTRGCTNKCRFCYLQYLPNRALRLRPIESVVEEVAAMPQSIVLFVDDNVFAAPDYATEAFESLIPLDKKWWIQAPTNLHRMNGLIHTMSLSGCFSVSIGFQTASNLNNQRELILQNKVEEYGALVKELQGNGILVDGTFIFGFDGDTPETFDATADLITRIGLDTYTFYFLTPYPGTEYFAQFEREERLLHCDWSRYDWDHVVVRPRQMTPCQLRDGVRSLYQRLDSGYFLRHTLAHLGARRKFARSPALLRFLMSTGWNYLRSPLMPSGL